MFYVSIYCATFCATFCQTSQNCISIYLFFVSHLKVIPTVIISKTIVLILRISNFFIFTLHYFIYICFGFIISHSFCGYSFLCPFRDSKHTYFKTTIDVFLFFSFNLSWVHSLLPSGGLAQGCLAARLSASLCLYKRQHYKHCIPAN